MDRRTIARQELIATALADLGRFVSARELHRLLVARGSTISLSSVYRALGPLDGADVEQLPSPGGETLYRSRSSPGDCAIVCRECGSNVVVRDEGMLGWVRRIAEENAFSVVTLRAVFTGTCDECALRHRL